MSTDILPNVDDTSITVAATQTLGTSRALVVRDGPSYEQAGAQITGLRSLSRQIEEFFAEPTNLAHKAWKALTTKRAGLVQPIEAEVSRLGREMASYSAEQERLARIAHAAEAERIRDQEQAAALAEAAALEHAGFGEEAIAAMDDLLARPMVVTTAAAPAVPKVEGVSYREVWKHKVVDESRIAREWMCVDEAKIARTVAATKGTIRIPGVEIYVERVPVVRGRA